METRDLSDEGLLSGLCDHTCLRSRIAALLELAQDTNSELERADDAQDSLAINRWIKSRRIEIKAVRIT